MDAAYSIHVRILGVADPPNPNGEDITAGDNDDVKTRRTTRGRGKCSIALVIVNIDVSVSLFTLLLWEINDTINVGHW